MTHTYILLRTKYSGIEPFPGFRATEARNRAFHEHAVPLVNAYHHHHPSARISTDRISRAGSRGVLMSAWKFIGRSNDIRHARSLARLLAFTIRLRYCSPARKARASGGRWGSRWKRWQAWQCPTRWTRESELCSINVQRGRDASVRWKWDLWVSYERRFELRVRLLEHFFFFFFFSFKFRERAK